MERDLKTLRRSRLMNYSEFRNMTTALERHHKDVKLAFMTGRKDSNKDLDMRPYLYDEGDSYERPFYGTLLKMLYEVATSKFYNKQYEDLKKIYKWYNANKKLISSPPVIPIPEPQNQKDEALQKPTEDDNDKDDDDMENKEKFKQVPKLQLRPKTAPPIESKKGVRYVTWNETQGKNGTKRLAVSGKLVFRYQTQEQYAREQLGKALKISQIGYHGKDGLQADRSIYYPSLYMNRPGTAPPTSPQDNPQVQYKENNNIRSFILKPYSTPVPRSSPINSPLTSPRDSPVSFRSKSPQLSIDFSPELAKDPSIKLNVRLPKDDTDSKSKTTSRQEDNDDKQDSKKVHPDLPSKLPAPQPLPDNPSTSELEQIIRNQKHEESLLEEQHSLLQTKLLHEYDKYARECAALEKERKANIEIVEGHLALNMNGGQKGSTLYPSTVGTYAISQQDTIPSFSRIYFKPKEGHSRSKSADGTQIQSGYSPARHVRHTSVPYNRPDVVNVNAVLSMVTPIGMQMEYDRERVNGYVSHGMKQPSTSIPHQTTQETTHAQEESYRETSPVSQSSCSSTQDVDSPRSSFSAQTPLELRTKEPELNPERTDRDYKVHFHHNKPSSDPHKGYKTSGPVCPDTIRYQWTDDGFGSMTYMKKLKSPMSPRSPKKKPNVSQTSKQAVHEHVTLPSSSRSVDKRTLASLVLIRQLGEADRRDGSRFGVSADRSATVPPPEQVDHNYRLEYMSFCQPVGPRLGETDRPSTVAWYLQGDHGLYREPGMRYDSEESRKRDVRIAQDRSLMIEGKHIGGDVEYSESKATQEKPPTNEETEKKIEEPKKETEPTNTATSDKDKKDPSKLTRASLRPTSPRPKRPLFASSCEHHHISIPTEKGFGTSSRPCSARSDKSEKTYNFSVKQFNHFCWPDEAILSDDYIRQREIWAAVNIQRIFRGYMARQYFSILREAERDRQRRAALTLQSHLRGYLTRKRMEIKMKDYKPTTRTKEWARKYKEDLKLREAARVQKKNITLLKMNKEAEKLDENIKHVKAHQHIFDIYHPVREGPRKAEMKAAAITIQRYFRGWFVRRMYQKVKSKALKRTLSFNKFIKGYQSLLYRIQKRYGVKDPTTNLQYNELMEYVERLNKYEIAFEKFAVNGVLSYNDIKKYFKAVGHVPSQKEIDEAIEIVTKMPAQGRSLTKAEAVEILFQIYVPRGTGMKLADVRKSTWLNPLSDGQDIMQLLSKKDLEATNLAKCLSLVANAGKENEEIQDLLRPSSAKSNKKSESKKNKSRDQDRRVTLAQYPMRPSSSRSRSKSPKPKR